MKTLGYYNGRYGELDEMTVPMTDRVCFFGDGVYDATYSRNYRIFDLEAHIDRFYESAELIGISVPKTKKDLTELLWDLVEKMDSGNHFVYFQVTRGTGPRRHEFPPQPQKSNLWITITPKEMVDIRKRVSLITLADTRHLHCNIKTLNLLPAVMASQKAKEKNCFEAVFHRADRVTECAHSNVHILKDGVFITPPADHLILAGITRKNLLRTCKELGVPAEERPFTLTELFRADEVLISSAGALCIAAETVDGKQVGGKSPNLLTRLQNAMEADFIRRTGG